MYDPAKRRLSLPSSSWTRAAGGRSWFRRIIRTSLLSETSQVASKGPRKLDGRQKPDVLLSTSEATYTDGLRTAETSNAAAYFAGIVAVLKAEAPGLRPEHLTRYISELSAQTGTAGQQPGVDGAGTVSQPGDEQKVGFDFVTKYFDPIVRAVYQLSGHQPMEAFQRQNDKRVILTVAHLTEADESSLSANHLERAGSASGEL